MSYILAVFKDTIFFFSTFFFSPCHNFKGPTSLRQVVLEDTWDKPSWETGSHLLPESIFHKNQWHMTIYKCHLVYKCSFWKVPVKWMLTLKYQSIVYPHEKGEISGAKCNNPILFFIQFLYSNSMALWLIRLIPSAHDIFQCPYILTSHDFYSYIRVN